MLQAAKVIGTGLATNGLIGTRKGCGVSLFSSRAALFINGDSQDSNSQDSNSQDSNSQDSNSQTNNFDNSRSNPASWSADNVLPDDGYGIDFIEEVKLYCDTPEKAAEYFKEKRESVKRVFWEDTEDASPGEIQGHLHQKNLVMARLNIQKRIIENYHLGVEIHHLSTIVNSDENSANPDAVAGASNTPQDNTTPRAKNSGSEAGGSDDGVSDDGGAEDGGAD